MIVELIVTSAPRGLQAGRSGFTTVMRTKGIHPDLASRLEAASGYRHTYPQGDPRNPVVFSFTNIPSAAGDGWVLSRIGDAGTDYTGRSNKIAHHIALKPDDIRRLAASDPASVLGALATGGGFKTVWKGDPTESTTVPALPMPPSQPAVCERWRAAAGDPGWAGVLVERALKKETTWIIAPPETDILGLFAEALALLSPSQRWQIPFTTFSLNRNEGRWLATVPGTPEAEAARSQPRALVIDLTKPSTPPIAGPYVQAARGLTPPPWVRVHAPHQRQGESQHPSPTVPAQASCATASGVHARPDPIPPPMQGQPNLPPALKKWPGSLPEPIPPWYASPLVLCTAGVALLTVASLTIVSQWANPPRDDDAMAKVDTNPPTPQAVPPAEVQGTKPPEEAPNQPAGDGAQDQKEAIENDVGEPGAGGDTSVAKAPADMRVEDAASPAPREPTVLELIAAKAADHSSRESLPLGPNEQDNREPVSILKWEVPGGDLHQVTLSIPPVNGEDQSQYKLVAQASEGSGDMPAVIWKCFRAEGQEYEVGSFRVMPKEVTFTPNENYTAHAKTLPLRPLVFQDAKAVASPAWVRLHPPLQREVYASLESVSQPTPLFEADEQEGEALVNAMKVTDVTLEFPEGIVAQRADAGINEPFSAALNWQELKEDGVFRWRPASWDQVNGVWLLGRVKLEPTNVGGSVCLNATLLLGGAACIPEGIEGEFRCNNRFIDSLGRATAVPVQDFESVLHFAALASVEPDGVRSWSSQLVRKRQKLIIDRIKESWSDLDRRSGRVDREFLRRVGVSHTAFTSVLNGKQSQSAGLWVEFIRTCLLAYRIAEEFEIPSVPASEEPTAEPERAKHRKEVDEWEKKIEEVKASLRPSDKVSFRRWCESVVHERRDTAEADVAQLWMLLSALEEDVRHDRRCDSLRESMRPRVAAEIVIEWQSPHSGLPLTVMELTKGAGRFEEKGLATEAVPSIPEAAAGDGATGEPVVGDSWGDVGGDGIDGEESPSADPPAGDASNDGEPTR